MLNLHQTSRASGSSLETETRERRKASVWIWGSREPLLLFSLAQEVEQEHGAAGDDQDQEEPQKETNQGRKHGQLPRRHGVFLGVAGQPPLTNSSSCSVRQS